MTSPNRHLAHTDDTRAVEALIARGILSPGARSMTIAQIAEQHNGVHPEDQDRIDPQIPLAGQLPRLIRRLA